jgi:hypothetical protein
VPLLWRKRLAVLLAALTVPAMAATGGVGSLPGPAAESTSALATRQAAAAALPFERPGMSFPGSAFFYMADPAGTALMALPKSDPLASRGGPRARAGHGRSGSRQTRWRAASMLPSATQPITTRSGSIPIGRARSITSARSVRTGSIGCAEARAKRPPLRWPLRVWRAGRRHGL